MDETCNTAAARWCDDGARVSQPTSRRVGFAGRIAIGRDRRMAAFEGGGGLERLREHRAAERAESERLHSLRAAGVTDDTGGR